jgi:hypothetical protein
MPEATHYRITELLAVVPTGPDEIPGSREDASAVRGSRQAVEGIGTPASLTRLHFDGVRQMNGTLH